MTIEKSRYCPSSFKECFTFDVSASNPTPQRCQQPEAGQGRYGKDATSQKPPGKMRLATSWPDSPSRASSRPTRRVRPRLETTCWHSVYGISVLSVLHRVRNVARNASRAAEVRPRRRAGCGQGDHRDQLCQGPHQPGAAGDAKGARANRLGVTSGAQHDGAGRLQPGRRRCPRPFAASAYDPVRPASRRALPNRWSASAEPGLSCTRWKRAAS